MRLLSFVLLTGALFVAGRYVPLLGGLWRSLPILALLASAGLAGALIERTGEAARSRRIARGKLADLSRVDTPAQRGKLGVALLAAGRPRQALTPLERAREVMPDNAELAWRHGQALSQVGRWRAAREAFDAALVADEELGYGQAQLDLARACARLSDWQAGLVALTRFERNHGANFESAYRRGVLHEKAGERGLAKEAFGEVPELARAAPRYQRGRAGWFAFLANIRRLL